MRVVCAPVKKWPSSRPVELYEFKEGSIKLLYDAFQTLRYIDIDWKEKEKKEDRLIVSSHTYDSMPDLEPLYQEMKQRHPGARYYKIAAFARSTIDALKMVHFQRTHPDVIGICMGEHGVITRILSNFTYAPLQEEDKNAPGQLLWSELDQIYHFRSITPSTRLYGLIGNPVCHSIGHLFHNDRFHKMGWDGVYLKMAVTPEEIPSFFKTVETLPFFGLSVTAPLKDKVMPGFIINTLYRTEKGWEGCSTDGVAAAEVLEPLQGKKVVILGAGGAARAIGEELMRRGAWVQLLRRQELIPVYDILINATSSHNPDYIDHFIPEKVVMDVATRLTPFLWRARMHKCTTIDGFMMYFGQAFLQSELWRKYYLR